MNINLRFGMHRDIPQIHAAKHNINGLVVPAHILAHQEAATSVFVASMHDIPYFIDPMTFLLQSYRAELSNDKDELRSSVVKLARAYSDDIFKTLEALPPNGSLQPDDFRNFLNDLCTGSLNFQKDAVSKASGTSKANKYLKRYQSTIATKPHYIVPPYFRFNKIGDEWYNICLNCSHLTKSLHPENSDDVVPVIFCSSNALTGDATERITEDYREFRRVIIWLDDFDEMGVGEKSIRRAADLVTSVANEGITPETLYGGYLSVALALKGLSAVSHGILYSQHKSHIRTPGGGGVPERFYIPKFHQFRSLSQTDLILHKFPELICNCEICSKHLGGNPDNIIRYADEPELLRQHFLEVRRREADEIAKTSANEVIAELQNTFKQYHADIGSLPNPDAFVSRSRMHGLEYLQNWCQGLADG
jgi:hypothetical protein